MLETRKSVASAPVVRLLALLLALGLVAAACGGSDDDSSDGGNDGTTGPNVAADEGEPTPGGVLRMAVPAEIDGLNPAKNRWSLEGNTIASSVFDTLMTFDEERTLVPRLAESVEPNDDGTVWTITLRPNVTFHDGTEFDADAVKLNIDTRKADPISGGALAPIQEIVVVDPLTVEVRMSTPWYGYEYTLAAQGGYMAAPAQLNAEDGSKKAIGTGPFKQEGDFTPGRPIEMVRNDDYWDTDNMPLLDGIEFSSILDETARAASLESGQVDMILTQNPDDITKFRTASGFEQAEDVAAEETFVMLQTAVPPFDNIHARKALAHATNPEAINAAVGGGIQLEADQPYTPEERYHVEDAGYPAYDPEQAEAEVELYKQDTGESSLRFTIKSSTGNRQLKEAELLQAQWAEVGIEASIEPAEQAVFLQDMFFADFQAAMFRNFAYVNPDSNYIFWHSSQAKGEGAGSINFGQIKSDAVDQALDTARATTDDDTRLTEYQDVVKGLNEYIAFIWLYHNTWGLAAQEKVGGLSEPQRLGYARQDGKPWWPAIWIQQ
jgi:peptide/nickel transport system substrate-binding protein